jgi:hypothetical protein
MTIQLIAANVGVYDGLGLGALVKSASGGRQAWPVEHLHLADLSKETLSS